MKKVKGILAGFFILVEVVTTIYLGVCFFKINATSEPTANNSVSTQKQTAQNTAHAVQTPSGEIASDDAAISEGISTPSDSRASRQEAMQKQYADLIERYESTASRCKKYALTTDSTISQVLSQADELLKEMGNVDLENGTPEEILELSETMVIMVQVLDQLDDTINVMVGEESPDVLVWNGDLEKDFTVKTISGENFSLSKNAGKVVVLNFWSGWCTPSTDALKTMDKLTEDYKDSDVVILTINCGESQGKVESYLKENSIKAACACDTVGEITAKYNLTTIPFTVVFNKDGSLNSEVEGYMGETLQYESLKKIIDDASYQK